VASLTITTRKTKSGPRYHVRYQLRGRDVARMHDRQYCALPPARSAPPRLTIWHQAGVPARELAERAGHSRPSMTLDVYSHVMPPDEVAPERFWH
jgi:integrase